MQVVFILSAFFLLELYIYYSADRLHNRIIPLHQKLNINLNSATL